MSDDNAMAWTMVAFFVAIVLCVLIAACTPSRLEQCGNVCKAAGGVAVWTDAKRGVTDQEPERCECRGAR